MIFDVTDKLVIDPRTREWCKLSYSDHPNGCPNYNKRDTCPPKAPLINEYFDLKQSHWFAIIKYNVTEHAVLLKEKHPDWSDKQCRCCLYWQNTARKQLRDIIKKFIKEKNFVSNFSDTDIGKLDYTLIPEAMGVNVFRTCRKIGVHIMKNPINIIYKVALIGSVK